MNSQRSALSLGEKPDSVRVIYCTQTIRVRGLRDSHTYLLFRVRHSGPGANTYYSTSSTVQLHLPVLHIGPLCRQ
jgi:hypothetical protein